MNYSEFLKDGLNEERYLYLSVKCGNDDEDIEQIVSEWGIDNVNKGYEIFDFDGTGMLEVEAIGEVVPYDDEWAVESAVCDGVKIIPISDLPDNFDRMYYGWIDTEKNRKTIEDYCSKDNYYCNGNSIENKTRY